MLSLSGFQFRCKVTPINDFPACIFQISHFPYTKTGVYPYFNCYKISKFAAEINTLTLKINSIYMKKVGILGSGMVGQTLAKGFLKHGYSVMVGTRNIAKLADWDIAERDHLKIGSFSETAAFGDILVLAVKGKVAIEALNLAGSANLSGKIIIDATNPIDDTAAPENGVLRFYTSLNRSFMEELQQAFPQAHFVKAFNSIGSAFMVNPAFESTPTMFICGNNEPAKKEVGEIVRQFGFEVEDMGMAEAARAIEPLCMLWCIPGFRENRWMHAFKLLKK